MQKRVLCTLVAVLLLAMVVPYAFADNVVVIQNYGAPTFLYGGYSYVPLKSAADFVGAALLWDSVRNRATLTYNGREVGMTIGSPNVYYGGRTVAMPVAPIMVEDRVLVPALVFDRYLGVPTRWDDEDDRLMLQGPHGWGYYQVAPAPPPTVIAVIERHGPPPWAPAHGRRRHGPTYVVAAPFVYSGVTYVPLRDAASLIGAALLWDGLKGRAVLTYNGDEIGLAIGSPTVIYAGQPVVLAAAPVVVQEVVYVPVDFCRTYLKIPVQHDRGVVKLKGLKGWHEYKVASRPPGPVGHGHHKVATLTPWRDEGPRAEKRVRAGKRRGGEGRVKNEGRVKREDKVRSDPGRDPFKRGGGRVERARGGSERGQGASKHGGSKPDRGGGKGQGKGKGGR